MKIPVLETGHEVERECAKVGTAVGDGADACGDQSVDLADVGGGIVQRVVDADVLHEVEMQ